MTHTRASFSERMGTHLEGSGNGDPTVDVAMVAECQEGCSVVDQLVWASKAGAMLATRIARELGFARVEIECGLKSGVSFAIGSKQVEASELVGPVFVSFKSERECLDDMFWEQHSTWVGVSMLDARLFLRQRRFTGDANDEIERWLHRSWHVDDDLKLLGLGGEV